MKLFPFLVIVLLLFSACEDCEIVDPCEEELTGIYFIKNQRNYELDFEIRYNGNIEFAKRIDANTSIQVSIDIPSGETKKVINLIGGITVNTVDTIFICQTSERIIN